MAYFEFLEFVSFLVIIYFHGREIDVVRTYVRLVRDICYVN